MKVRGLLLLIFPFFLLQSSSKDYIGILIRNRLFIEYVETVLLEERVSLVNYTIYHCIATFLPKV